MPNTYIKDSGDWALVQRPWVKDGGSWKPIKKIWVKTDAATSNRTVTTTLTSGSGTWKVPLTISSATITLSMIGAGGNGNSNTDYAPGPGGGSGAYFKDKVISVSPGQEFFYKVGASGEVKTNGGYTISGGDTIFGDLKAGGGEGGHYRATHLPAGATVQYEEAGIGGIAVGAGGVNGTAGTAGGKYGGSGLGADSPFGIGGKAYSGNQQNGGAASGYGSGGGGGGNNGADGNGAPGIIWITYEETIVTPTTSQWKQVFGNTGTQIFRNSATTKIYPVGGNIKSYKVPDGVTQLTVSAIAGGGSGGDGAGAGGGSDGPHGGYKGQAVTTTLSVTPGETLTVELGVGGLPVAYGSGLAGKPGSDTVIKRGSTELLRVTGGAGGERNTSGTSLSRGEDSDAPFNGPGGAFKWGGQGEPGIVGSGGAGVDGGANGKTSGAGGAGAVYISTPSVSTFTVPPGVYSIDVTFPSADGNLMTVPVPVTPKDNIAITVGGIGQDSSFGSLVIPHENYNKRVIYHYGSVDRYFRQTVQVATATGNSYTSANNVGASWPDNAKAGVDDQATISSQALAKGITITTDLENSWGDLKQYIQVNPLKNDGTLPSSLVATAVLTKGRGTVSIEQQPSAANGYKVRTLVDDNSPSAADYYEYSVYVETPAYISISY